MVDQLQERIEREARFNSDVSHELRSPLTTLAAVARGARGRPGRPRRRAPSGPSSCSSDDLRRFQRMVGDLLEMSRADAGSVDVFLEEVNVSELVQRSVEAGVRAHGRPRPAAAARVHVDPAVRHVAGGRRQAALRAGHGQPDGERRPLRRRASPEIAVGPGDDTSVEVTVDDAGPGIDPLERTKVFERFYRGSASGRRGTGTGTGSGLALVAEHMRAHARRRSGSRRRPQGGARFVLTLPVLRPTATTPRTASA